MSTEERTKDGNKSYIIDFTARFPYSLSLTYTESIKNYSEVIWKVASGEEVTLEPAAKYVVCAPIESPHAEKSWLRLNFDEKLRHKIKLQQACKMGGHYYCVKGNRNGALIMSTGDDYLKCIEDIKNTAEEVNAHELSRDGIMSLYGIVSDLKKLKKLGIKF
jgi:hypothetical protein